MNIVLFSCSLHLQSRSFVLAQAAAEMLRNHGVEPRLYDLRQLDLPLCGPPSATEASDTQKMIQVVRDADAILMAVPVYNFYANASAKNLIELTGRAWTDKIVGFLCAAGGQRSYMSVMNMANSLMLDFRCLVVPRFVYAVGDDFGDDRLETMYISSPQVKERIEQLTSETVRLTKALA
ncbi:MAG: NAD(P)H-dependent oxidoreductase [Chloroflexota bacterium]